MHQAQIRRHLVARLEHHHVAQRQFVGAHALLLPVAKDGCAAGHRMGQGLDGLYRLGFLDEPDQAVHQHHAKDDNGINPLLKSRGYHAGADEDVNEGLVELEQEPHQRALSLRRGKGVPPVLFLPLLRFGFLEAPLRMGLEVADHLLHRYLMPLFALGILHSPP